MSVRGIWGHLTFLVGNVPPKMPPNGCSCSYTALDHAGHRTTASYWITSVLWTLTEQAGSEIGGGGGNRTPVRRSSAKYDYMLSRCFDLAPRAPSGRVSWSQPVWISASSPPAEESANPTK